MNKINKIYFASLALLNILYFLFVIIVQYDDIINCQTNKCNDLLISLRSVSNLFFVFLSVLISYKFFKFWGRSVSIFCACFFFLFLYADPASRGWSIGFDDVSRVLSYYFTIFLFVTITLLHIYDFIKNGIYKNIKETAVFFDKRLTLYYAVLSGCLYFIMVKYNVIQEMNCYSYRCDKLLYIITGIFLFLLSIHLATRINFVQQIKFKK